jgi:hypothetical protein
MPIRTTRNGGWVIGRPDDPHGVTVHRNDLLSRGLTPQDLRNLEAHGITTGMLMGDYPGGRPSGKGMEDPDNPAPRQAAITGRMVAQELGPEPEHLPDMPASPKAAPDSMIPSIPDTLYRSQGNKVPRRPMLDEERTSAPRSITRTTDSRRRLGFDRYG